MKLKKRYLLAGFSGLATAAVVTKLLARPRDVDLERSRDRIYHVEHSRFIDVNGLRVHYQEAGDPAAPPLFLIHGFLSSTFVWSRVFLGLAAAGFRVIAPDLIGYGYSAKPRNFDYSIESQAKMLAGLLERLGSNGATLVGSSYGGAVAATVALDQPELVRKLVLVGAVSNNEPKRFMMMRLVRTPVVGDIVSPLLAGSRRLLRARMKRVYDRHQASLDEFRVDVRFLPLRAAGTHRAIIRTVRNWDAERIQREARLIKQPTLLIWGDNDPDVPLRDGEELQQQIESSRLLVFRDCGHHPQEEYPTSFTEAVLEFCDKPLT
ncbi:MAG TPA: alpha/beta hydrolase [Pyrinomonadaceae bacterium]|nr:alpha/beta hydrolase [Pyrinomonadaceae bacterium]